jgi:BED zinc finger
MANSIVTSIELSSPSIPTLQTLLQRTPTPILSRRGENRRIRGVSWLRAGRRANIRRGSQISRIWDHGDEYIDISRPETSSSWICDYCDSVIAIRKTLSSLNVIRHLKDAHQILLKRTQTDREEEDEAKSILSHESSI